MNRRSLLLSAGALALLGAATESCGPPYLVIRAASPDPFINRHLLNVEPVHFEGLQVGRASEAEWLSRKSPQQVEGYMNDRAAMIDVFTQNLANSVPGVQIILGGAPAPDGLVIRPFLRFLEPGSFNGFFNLATRTRMIIQVVTPQGQVIEEVALEDTVASDLTNPSTGGRLRAAGAHLARKFGEYVRHRMMGTF